MTRSRTKILWPVLLVALAVAAPGCSSYRSSRQAQIAAETGDWDRAVVEYMKAVEQDPTNIQHRAALLRARIAASQHHFDKAKKYQAAGVLERALVELQQAVQLDPTNQYAEAELAKVREALQAVAEGRGVSTIEELKQKTSGARPQPPQLDPRSDKPISLNFPEPTSIFQIYRALGKAFGINVLFDPNLKDSEIPIELEDVTAETALETLMRAAGHFYKVQDEHTIIIAADTPQNRRTYEDLVIQTFFLSNSEVKEMMTILRSLVDAKKIATNEQLNAIILRDTADKVKVAERIIEANDKARAEVVIDVELMQLDTTALRDLGVSLDPYTITQSLDTGTENNVLRLSDIQFLNQNNWTLTIPNFIYTFIKQSSDAQLLARPQLRISEGEKARLVIGDRVPIPVTTFNTANTVGGNIVPITSFQYQEVGITIEIEPRVHHNREITMKVQVEVSNISGFIEGSGGQQQPRIGTRTINSVIRLKDGETNFLAGLIRTDESNSESGVPGLSEIPVLGQLFSKRRHERNRTDVILTLTPHIVRNAQITELDLLPIWVGTEANITFRGGSPRVESDVTGPFDDEGRSPEELQELMRRRLQQLPRGLQEGVETEPPIETPGIDLVPPPPSGFDEDEEEQEEQFEDGFAEPEPFEPETSALPPAPPWPGAPAPGEGLGVLPATAAAAGTPFVPTARWAAGPPPAGAADAAAGSAPVGEAPSAERSSAEASSGEPAVRLRLAPNDLSVIPGDRFEIRLLASAGRPVSHLPLELAYDPELLAVERVERGGFLGAEAESQVLADRSRPGRVLVGASRLGAVAGVDGSGTLLRITFRALAEGEAELTFTAAAARDADLEPLSLAVEPARVRVTADAPPRQPRRDSERPEGRRPRSRPASPEA
jgi:general secretion pathway protein D